MSRQWQLPLTCIPTAKITLLQWPINQQLKGWWVQNPISYCKKSQKLINTTIFGHCFCLISVCWCILIMLHIYISPHAVSPIICCTPEKYITPTSPKFSSVPKVVIVDRLSFCSCLLLKWKFAFWINLTFLYHISNSLYLSPVFRKKQSSLCFGESQLVGIQNIWICNFSTYIVCWIYRWLKIQFLPDLLMPGHQRYGYILIHSVQMKTETPSRNKHNATCVGHSKGRESHVAW